MLHLLRYLSQAVLLAAWAGCAVPPSGADSNAASARVAVEERVSAYWNARKNSDLAAAYAFYSPEFQAATARSIFLRNYQRLIRFPPASFAIEAIELDATGREATVKVRLNLDHEVEGTTIPMTGVTEEIWVYVDRNWWKKDEPLRINI
jgi:hypothetical protein